MSKTNSRTPQRKAGASDQPGSVQPAGSAGPCPICGDPGCIGNECSPPEPEPLACCHCGGRGHILGEDCDWCDGTGEE